MTVIAAILLVCTHGDRDVAAVVHAAAVHAQVDPALALAVACQESGLHGGNPMGVMLPTPTKKSVACHRTGQFDAAACIEIGVRSLANRLRGCRGDERCAIAAYNGSSYKKAYAKRVSRIVRFVRSRLTTPTNKPTLR